MHSQIKKYWHIFWVFRRLRVMQLMENRTNFFFWTFVSLVWTGFNLIFFSALFQIAGGIGSWSTNELYILLATYTIIDAFTWGLFFLNMKDYTSAVQSGALSTHLLKPISTQYMVLVQNNSFDQFPRAMIGVGMLLWAVKQLGRPISLNEILLYLALLVTTFFFLYFLWFFLATFSFWVERLENINDIVPSLRRIWELPREVYRGTLSTILTFFLPLALIVSVPSESLIGKSPSWLVLYYMIFTVIFCIAVSWFFRFSIKRYTSIGG
jgi:ABC-2 type transport system permease protein